jgi:hypothetical protein
VASVLQIVAFFILLKRKEIERLFTLSISRKLITIVVLAYALKIVFQLFASFNIIQEFLIETSSYTIIGFIHLVMLGFFSLFFLAVFIEERFLDLSKLTKLGIVIFIIGIFLSELLLFSQSLSTFFLKQSISNFTEILFWSSALMPLGIVLITYGFLTKPKANMFNT